MKSSKKLDPKEMQRQNNKMKSQSESYWKNRKAKDKEDGK